MNWAGCSMESTGLALGLPLRMVACVHTCMHALVHLSVHASGAWPWGYDGPHPSAQFGISAFNMCVDCSSRYVRDLCKNTGAPTHEYAASEMPRTGLAPLLGWQPGFGMLCPGCSATERSAR